MKAALKHITPPFLVDVYRRVRFGKSAEPDDLIEWECVRDGWLTRDPNIKGWDVESVVSTSLMQWPKYVKSLRGPEAIRGYYGGSPTSPISYVAHNIFMTFAYVVVLAARQKNQISILDWGGGLGHYCEFAKSLLPDVEIEYHCREVPKLCEAGRKVLPEAHFHDKDDCLDRKYDLVFSSSSLQYHEKWQGVLTRLAAATGEFLYVTRLPVVENSESFVVVQRPYKRGYDTEYIGWFLNRGEVLDCIAKSGLQLVREFHIEPHPDAKNAPAPALSRGFLARRL